MKLNKVDNKIEYISEDGERFKAIIALSAIINDCRVRHIAALGVKYNNREKLFEYTKDGYISSIAGLEIKRFIDIIKDVFDLTDDEIKRLNKIFLTKGKLKKKINMLAELILSNDIFIYLLSEFDFNHIGMFTHIVINESGVNEVLFNFKRFFTKLAITDIDGEVVDELIITHTRLGYMVNIRTNDGLWSLIINEPSELELAINEYVDSYVLTKR